MHRLQDCFSTTPSECVRSHSLSCRSNRLPGPCPSPANGHPPPAQACARPVPGLCQPRASPVPGPRQAPARPPPGLRQASATGAPQAREKIWKLLKFPRRIQKFLCLRRHRNFLFPLTDYQISVDMSGMWKRKIAQTTKFPKEFPEFSVKPNPTTVGPVLWSVRCASVPAHCLSHTTHTHQRGQRLRQSARGTGRAQSHMSPLCTLLSLGH